MSASDDDSAHSRSHGSRSESASGSDGDYLPGNSRQVESDGDGEVDEEAEQEEEEDIVAESKLLDGEYTPEAMREALAKGGIGKNGKKKQRE
jgi:hypothetical protein